MDKVTYKTVHRYVRANGLQSAINHFSPSIMKPYYACCAANHGWDLLDRRWAAQKAGLTMRDVLEVWTTDSVWSAIMDRRECQR